MEGLLNLGKLFAPELGSQGIREAEAAQLPGGMAALLAPQRFNNIRKASGNLFGVDTSTSKERLQKALGQLDMSTPQGQAKAVELVRAVDPAIAAQMQQQFKLSRESAAESAARTSTAATGESNMRLRAEELQASNSSAGQFTNSEQAEIRTIRDQLIRRGGYSPQDAQDFATRITTGQIEITPNEDGTATMTDKIGALTGSSANTRLPFIPSGATSEVTGLSNVGNQPLQSAAPAEIQSYADTIGTEGGPSLFEAAEQGTGFWNVTRDVAGRFFNNFYEGALDEEKTQAADTLKNATMPLIRSLSLNPRFPVGEQDRIRESIKIEPKLLRSPGELKVHLVGVDNILEKEQNKLLERMSDPQTQPSQVSQDRVSFRDVQAFRDMIFPKEVRITSIDSSEQVKNMSRTRARGYINNATDQELERLSPEVMAEFLNILR
jgi:hypothetical protein